MRVFDIADTDFIPISLLDNMTILCINDTGMISILIPVFECPYYPSAVNKPDICPEPAIDG